MIDLEKMILLEVFILKYKTLKKVFIKILNGIIFMELQKMHVLKTTGTAALAQW